MAERSASGVCGLHLGRLGTQLLGGRSVGQALAVIQAKDARFKQPDQAGK